jgi:hypothetical protein
MVSIKEQEKKKSIKAGRTNKKKKRELELGLVERIRRYVGPEYVKTSMCLDALEGAM